MKTAPANTLVNTIKKDNSLRKVKMIAYTFNEAVLEIDDPRTKTGAIDYPLVEILFTALAVDPQFQVLMVDDIIVK